MTATGDEGGHGDEHQAERAGEERRGGVIAEQHERRDGEPEDRGPQGDDDDELDERQREAEHRIDHVAPAVRVEELPLGVRAQPLPVRRRRAVVKRAIGVRAQRSLVGDLHARALGASEEAAGLDAEADDGDAHEDHDERAARRPEGREDGEARQRDEGTDEDRQERQPRGRVEGREQQRAHREALCASRCWPRSPAAAHPARPYHLV